VAVTIETVRARALSIARVHSLSLN